MVLVKRSIWRGEHNSTTGHDDGLNARISRRRRPGRNHAFCEGLRVRVLGGLHRRRLAPP
jgi:hypothetical protein